MINPNPFESQKKFMKACDQIVDSFDQSQYNLYISLITEEYQELLQALDENNQVEQLDALIDILVVTIGALHSLNVDAQGAWNEVMKTNFAKVDKTTGKVRRRHDGKILKGPDWKPPQLEQFILGEKE